MMAVKTNAQAVVLPASVRFAFIVGLLLLIEGICELFQPVVFGVLTSNPIHGLVHILLAIAGIMAGRSGHARGFLYFLGILLLFVASLWFVTGTNELMVRLFNMNRAVASVNVVVGLLSLAIAAGSSPTRVIED